MELHADERAQPRLGDEALRPGRGRGCRGGIRVREVERAAIVDLGPAHPRHASLADPLCAAEEQAEAWDAPVLLRPLERELQAEADSENRTTVVEALSQRLVVTARAEPVHRGAGAADARQHREVRAADVVREARAQPRERQRDRAQVAGAVLADGDVHSTPFVDGNPALSLRTAARSARPTALNAASATWCESRPVASTWIEARVACARLASMCSARPGSLSSRSSACGRPPRSTAARASASSIGTTASP